MDIQAFLCIAVIFFFSSGCREVYGTAAKESCKCGTEFKVKSRIVGGVEAARNEFPWQALMTYYNYPRCGAVLINDRYVLTAAHCFKFASHPNNTIQYVQIKHIQYLLGIHLAKLENNKHNEKRGVQKTILHPDYNPVSSHNDIALALLSSKVVFSFSILPPCFPVNITKSLDNHLALVSGWGTLNENSFSYSPKLRKASIFIKNGDECKTLFKTKYKMTFLKKSMICAYKDGEDSCQGDSGGPLIAKLNNESFTLVGIVSTGMGCARKDIPGIYTKVSAFMGFIMNNTKDAIFCE